MILLALTIIYLQAANPDQWDYVKAGLPQGPLLTAEEEELLLRFLINSQIQLPRLNVIIRNDRNPKAENDDPAPQTSLGVSDSMLIIFLQN